MLSKTKQPMNPVSSTPPTPMALSSVSPNHLQTWGRCQRQFDYQYVQQLRWPTDQRNFALGKNVHKLLDYHARGMEVTPLLQTATPEVQRAWQLLMAHPISQAPVVASEWGFQIPVDYTEARAEVAPAVITAAGESAPPPANQPPRRVWLTGRIDRIVRGDNGQVWVLDWKTGTAVPKDPANHWQTIVYLLAVLAAKDDLGLPDLTAEQLVFVYVGVSDAVRLVQVPFDTLQLAQYQARLQQSLQQLLSATDFVLPSRCPDAHCPYGTICGINQVSLVQ
jgi:hypothetical protein